MNRSKKHRGWVLNTLGEATYNERTLGAGILMKALPTLLFCLAGLLASASGFRQPDDLAAMSQRAKEFMAEGKFADAVPLYRELNQAVPNNPGLLLNLGLALLACNSVRLPQPSMRSRRYYASSRIIGTRWTCSQVLWSHSAAPWRQRSSTRGSLTLLLK